MVRTRKETSCVLYSEVLKQPKNTFVWRFRNLNSAPWEVLFCPASCWRGILSNIDLRKIKTKVFVCEEKYNLAIPAERHLKPIFTKQEPYALSEHILGTRNWTSPSIYFENTSQSLLCYSSRPGSVQSVQYFWTLVFVWNLTTVRRLKLSLSPRRKRNCLWCSKHTSPRKTRRIMFSNYAGATTSDFVFCWPHGVTPRHFTVQTLVA